jgi:hypothetical protein
MTFIYPRVSIYSDMFSLGITPWVHTVPLLRIRDILVRIRILGSVPLTNGSGFRILLFSSVTFKTPTKNIFFLSKFLCSFLFEGIFTSFCKDKKSQRSHKTVEISVFRHFFACDGRIPIRIRTNKLRIRIQEAQKKTYGSGSGTLPCSIMFSIIDFRLLICLFCGGLP